ncbi:hypothetical protein [Polymorphum gilvum]|nr:hypothetical protein [Polymorphum gilvum]
MAKGQLRSNREIRKPKKDRSAAPAKPETGFAWKPQQPDAGKKPSGKGKA